MGDLTNGNPVEESTREGRRATLLALRLRLAKILDGSLGHDRGCGCECGMPWDTGKVATISRELREVVRELDDLPNDGGGTEVDRLKTEREERQRQARAQQDQGDEAPPA